MASLIGLNNVTPGPMPNTKGLTHPFDSNPKINDWWIEDTKYKIGSFMYPEDIMDKQYGGNYAMFFINVQESSKLNEISSKNGLAEVLSNGLNSAVETGLNKVTSQVISGYTVGAVQAAIGVGQGAIGAKVLTKIAPGFMSKLTDKGKIILGVAATATVRAGAVGAIAHATGGFSKPVKRLKTAIVLHMPTSLAVRYSVSYEEAEIGLEYRGLQALGNNTDGTVATGIGAAAMGKAGSASGMISKLTKTAVNPVKEQIFKNVEFRTFSFTYTFAPRSQSEARNCLAIIEQFKFHMHPEFKDNDNFLYVYPSEFDITYYHNHDINHAIHRHTSCVLTDLGVSYTPQQTFSTFSDGTPTQMEMTLTFRELAKLDKANIMEKKL